MFRRRQSIKHKKTLTFLMSKITIMESSDSEKQLIVVLFFLSMIGSLTCIFVIRSFFVNKPFGLQTLQTKVSITKEKQRYCYFVP